MSDWLDGKSILNRIKAASESCKSNPISCFQKFLQAVWMDNTPSEAYRFWIENIVPQTPWWADNYLYVIRYVLDNPLEDFQEILKNDGWIMLYHEDENETEFTKEEYLAWLENMYQDFKKIYDDSPSFLENT